MDLLKLQDEFICRAYGRLQPANITAQFYGNAMHPGWRFSLGMGLQIQFLYPKKPR